jgi:hypothetical protein
MGVLPAYATYAGYKTFPTEALNPFNLKRYLGAGGNAAHFNIVQSVPTLDDGLSAGAGAYSDAGAQITAGSATSPGSGGGAAGSRTTTLPITSGAGADGAVFIYARGIVE